MSKPCQSCISGTIHAGQPQGKEEQIHGLNVYVVGNQANPRATIVIYSDIFGLGLPNNKIIADAYAKSGEYLVYLPDFFQGDPVKLEIADVLIPVDAASQSMLSKFTGILANAPSFLLWRSRHSHSATDKTCMEFLRKLREANAPGHKIGMVGMCWGGRYALRAARESNMLDVAGTKVPLVDAVVALHPSNLVIPEDVENLVVPTSIGWGKEDSVVSVETKGKIEGVHATAQSAGRKLPETDHQVYTPGRHGFSVRGNPEDPAERAILEGTEKQVLEWFQRWL